MRKVISSDVERLEEKLGKGKKILEKKVDLSNGESVVMGSHVLE